MSKNERQALIEQLHGHRANMVRLSAELSATRAGASENAARMGEFTSARILRLRIDIALIESRLAAAA